MVTEGAQAGTQQGVREFKKDISRIGEEVTNATHSGMAAAKDTLRHAYDAAKDKSLEATETARKSISANPLASVGIAAGVGFLLGMLVSRARS